jgi:hypothetical protein
VIGPRATTLTVALVASLAGGGGAAASLGTDPSATDSHASIATETLTPVMELPNGCVFDDWSFDSSVD